MEVVFQMLAFQMAKAVRCGLMVQPQPQGIQFLLDFLLAAFCLQPRDQFGGRLDIVFLSLRDIHGQLLVVFT
jgi:hypothetical protein